MNIFDGKHLSLGKACLVLMISSVSYLLASLSTHLTGLLPIYFLSFLYISKVKSYRHAFYLALSTSLLTVSLHINFFLNIFGTGSIILWLIISLWPAIFILLSKFILENAPKHIYILTVPALFFVIEIVSCELYPLRFSWHCAGYMVFENPKIFGLGLFGIYGFSLLLFSLSLIIESNKKRNTLLPVFCIFLSILSFIPYGSKVEPAGPKITGIQLEFPELIEALGGLNKSLSAQPDTDIFMLSEYSFKDGIPSPIKEWCRKNKVYLVAGTTFQTADKSNYYNTATIVNPQGEIEFRQAKAQPIQFFNDGLPAPEQKLWNSPWGKFGLCICYDLSYAKVIDKLVEQGAQALLVPTMDVESWGKSEHELHKRVAPVRAAEYSLPIFKVASSGISQSVNLDGKVLASAPFPGQGEIITARLHIPEKGGIPVDRYLFWPCVLLCLIGFYSAFKKEKVTS